MTEEQNLPIIYMNCQCGIIEESKLRALLQCNWCEAWFHLSCQENWKELRKDEDSLFICQFCRENK